MIKLIVKICFKHYVHIRKMHDFSTLDVNDNVILNKICFYLLNDMEESEVKYN
jgi:hypothetical protein